MALGCPLPFLKLPLPHTLPPMAHSRVDQAHSEVCVPRESAVHRALAQYLAVDAVCGDGGDGADHVAGVCTRHSTAGTAGTAQQDWRGEGQLRQLDCYWQATRQQSRPASGRQGAETACLSTTTALRHPPMYLMSTPGNFLRKTSRMCTPMSCTAGTAGTAGRRAHREGSSGLGQSVAS